MQILKPIQQIAKSTARGAMTGLMLEALVILSFLVCVLAEKTYQACSKERVQNGESLNEANSACSWLVIQSLCVLMFSGKAAAELVTPFGALVGANVGFMHGVYALRREAKKEMSEATTTAVLKAQSQ